MISIIQKFPTHSIKSGRAAGLMAAISTRFLIFSGCCCRTITTMRAAQRFSVSSHGPQHKDTVEPETLSKKDIEEFDALFPHIVEDIVGDANVRDTPIVNQWLANIFEYNVRGGKKNRGLATVLAYKFLSQELTLENIRLSYVLGWCTEIMQAFFLLTDDIIDESKIRRGKPCWYRVDDVGLGAFNDAVLLDGSIYRLLQKHFQHKDYYMDLVHVMNDASFKTAYGQCLDMRTGSQKRYDTYTMDLYSTIVKYKTSYYSCFLPNALAMIMAGISDPVIIAQAEEIGMLIGEFLQIQDDFIDCFGDEFDIKKDGTDISDGKCSWVIVTALERANNEQRKIILENYGKNDEDQIQRVKEVYIEIGIPNLYAETVKKNRQKTKDLIQTFDSAFPKELFYYTINKIDKQYKNIPC